MGGHQHSGVENLDEARAHHDLDGLPGEGRPHPIAQSPKSDRSTLVDPTVDAGRPLGQSDLVWDLGHLEVGGPLRSSQCETFDRRTVAQRLVRPLGVVLGDPFVEGSLKFVDGGVHSVVIA
jgi:hypothetical protein